MTVDESFCDDVTADSDDRGCAVRAEEEEEDDEDEDVDVDVGNKDEDDEEALLRGT